MNDEEMNEYDVYFMREVCLAHRRIKAKDEDEAESEAAKTVHKYDLDDTDRIDVKLIEEDIDEDEED